MEGRASPPGTRSIALERADEPRGAEPRRAWDSAEAVPLRVISQRIKAEERTERLRLVIGRSGRSGMTRLGHFAPSRK